MTDFVQTEFELGVPGGTLAAASYARLRKFVQLEREAWKLLAPGSSEQDSYGTWNTIQQGLNEISTSIDQASNTQAGPSVAQSAFSNQYRGTLRYSESPAGRHILDIAETAGGAAARFAYALETKIVQPSGIRTAEDFRGAILYVAPELQRPGELATRLGRERSNLRSLLRDTEARVEAVQLEQEQAVSDLAARARHLAARDFWRRRKLWRTERTARADQDAKMTVEMEALKNAYNESMRLQAPVQYWNDKARAHQTAERRAVVHLRWFFPLAVVGLGASFGGAAALLLKEQSGSVPTTIYFILSTGLAAIAAVTFWIGRILTKLYLSEHHLRHDADERAVMTTTYLALTKEKAAEESDRQIILSALFRATSDGIVKEEGPDLSVATLIAKLGSR